MSIINRVVNTIFGSSEKEQRDLIHGNVSLGDLLSNTSSVTEEEAMSIPAVKASVDLIASSVAHLPIKLHRVDENGEVVEVKNDYRLDLLNKEPNMLANAYTFKYNLTKDMVLHGNHYVYLTRVGNHTEALHSLSTKDISVQKYHKEGYIEYADIILQTDYATRTFDPDELAIFVQNSRDGVTGTGVLETGENVLKLALNELKYSENILENGAVPLGTLEVDSMLSDPAAKRLQKTFNEAYRGSKNAGRTIVLEEGLKYSPISLNPNELELTASKESTVSNIARLFNVPESMINSKANKYADNEQNNIHFLQFCLKPVIKAIELALDKSLLLEKEKLNNYFFKFDTSEVLQTTQKEKVEAVVDAYKGSVITMNEARKELDLPNMSGKDFYRVGLGDVFVDKESGVITIPNLGKLLDPSELKDDISVGELLAIEKKLNEIKQIKELQALKQENKELDQGGKFDGEEEDSSSTPQKEG